MAAQAISYTEHLNALPNWQRSLIPALETSSFPSPMKSQCERLLYSAMVLLCRGSFRSDYVFPNDVSTTTAVILHALVFADC